MIRVLVVDDSAVVRQVLSKGLSAQHDIEVIGSAVDPYAARDKIVKLRPDVITLDIEMPRMDGLSFLEKLMKHFPMPVVVVSSLTTRSSAAALRALELGAVDVMSKPSQYSADLDIRRLVMAVRAAAVAKLRTRAEMQAAMPATPSSHLAQIVSTHKVIAIGASTGGTQAIETVLRGLPANTPGIVIVQHMPAHFTATFAERLNQCCPMQVREARNGDAVVSGVALVAPGDRHMLMARSGARYLVRLKDGPAVHHQRPAVDVLFTSVATSVGRNAVGVILTGMGADGAKGLLMMRQQGAHTLAEDESTSVVFGMPREAIQLGAAVDVIPLPQVAQTIMRNVGAEVPVAVG